MADKTINIHAAKTQLSRLVERAAAGEEIVIARAGRPMAWRVNQKSASESPAHGRARSGLARISMRRFPRKSCEDLESTGIAAIYPLGRAQLLDRSSSFGRVRRDGRSLLGENRAGD
ncbi:MAG: type II toxin-antitoxin system Phd/YefM family antitoxin [Candidatus Binataceae bacterium]